MDDTQFKKHTHVFFCIHHMPFDNKRQRCQAICARESIKAIVIFTNLLIVQHTFYNNSHTQPYTNKPKTAYDIYYCDFV